jgi:PAS domain S-box-containing protein
MIGNLNKQLSANFEVLNALINSAVMGIMVIDRDGSIVLANPYCNHLFGYTQKEMIGQSHLMLIPACSRQQHQKHLRKFFDDPQSRPMGLGQKLFGLKKSGEQFPVEISLSHVKAQGEDYSVAFVTDITQQQEVSDENTLLSKIFQESLNGIYIINANTLKFELVNNGAVEQLGFTLSEFKLMHPWDIIPRMSPEQFKEILKSLEAKSQQKISYETQFARKNGPTLPVEVHLQHFRYDHKVVYMQIVIDLSERKATEEAMQLQSEITRNLSEGVVLIRAEDNKIVYTNAQFDSMFGYSTDELQGQPFSILVADHEQRDDNMPEFINSVLVNEGNWSGEVMNQHKNGHTFWSWVSITSFHHPSNGTVWVGVLRNIENRKKIEAELEQEKIKAQMYLDVAGSIFVVIEKDRSISLINQKGCEMLGYPEEEVLGKDWFAHFLPEHKRQKVAEIFDQAMQGDSRPLEYFVNPIVTRHQGERLIEWHNTIIYDEDGKPTAGLSSGIDITEKTQAEHAMTQALIEGQELERKRIAKELHDGLGQSLTAIRLHLGALESDLQQFSVKNQSSLDKLKFILQSTVQEVKSISRDLMPSILQDYGLVKAVEFLCQTIDDANEIQVEFQHYGMEFSLDQTQTVGLYRVAQELINNAVKHSGAQRVNVQLIGHDQSVVLLVEDDGKGFDTKSPANTHPTFGLKNIQTRVKSLAGILEIDSRPGVGTFATVEIPVYS